MKYRGFVLLIVLFSVFPAAYSMSLPVLEYGCYAKYADKSHNYSFVLVNGKQDISNSDPTVIKVPINSFEEICRYSASPKNCYDCITLAKYDITKTDRQENKSNSYFYIKYLLGIMVMILFAMAIKLIYKKKSRK